jgi:hypothetical protein
MKINIELDTFDKNLTSDIIGKKGISSGDKRDIFRNTTLEYQLTLKKFKVESPDTIYFTLDISGNVESSTSIFATWLHDNIKTRAIKLRINRSDVEIDESKIKNTINQIVKNKNESRGQ